MSNEELEKEITKIVNIIFKISKECLGEKY